LGRVVPGENIREITFAADANDMLDGISTAYAMFGEIACFKKEDGVRDIC
jgi:hypothetical protein